MLSISRPSLRKRLLTWSSLCCRLYLSLRVSQICLTRGRWTVEEQRTWGLYWPMSVVFSLLGGWGRRGSVRDSGLWAAPSARTWCRHFIQVRHSHTTRPREKMSCLKKSAAQGCRIVSRMNSGAVYKGLPNWHFLLRSWLIANSFKVLIAWSKSATFATTLPGSSNRPCIRMFSDFISRWAILKMCKYWRPLVMSLINPNNSFFSMTWPWLTRKPLRLPLGQYSMQ